MDLSCDLRRPVHTEIAACRKSPSAYIFAEASIALASYCHGKYCPRRGFAGHEAVLQLEHLCDEEFRRLSDADVHQPGVAADGSPVPGPGADIFTMDYPGRPA